MTIRAAPPTEAPEAAIPYAPPRSAARSDPGDRVESVGQKILELLNQAAEDAASNARHALDVTEKFSRQLQIAEKRLNDLEADLRHYRDRAERAEKWLNNISSEIEQKFFGSADRARR
jgi:DNA repair ATPase RecN